MSERPRVVVIGGGPGGYVAAIRAAQLGFSVSLVEKQHLGGICLNWGCIPAKSLLRSAEVLHLARNAERFGLSIPQVDFSLSAIVKRSRSISRRLASGVAYLMKKNGVTVVTGNARLREGLQVAISGDRDTLLDADHVIVATGARPRELPGLHADGDAVWTYFNALDPPRLPRHLLIVGSGAIGVEFAAFYRALGCEVTVVELAGHILPSEDTEISVIVRRAMEKSGITFHTGVEFAGLDRGSAPGCIVHLRDRDGNELAPVECDTVLSAAGVVGNVEDLGLEEAGVSLENGWIRTDANQATSVRGICAVGDVAGPPMLAHKAEHEAVVCVEACAGKNPRPMNPKRIPACTYGFPQVGSVGLTERAAKEENRDVRIGRFFFRANGKAQALGDDSGMAKTVWDASSGELLGAHLVGPEVTELIQGLVLSMELEATEASFAETVFPHPTLAEALHESALDAFGKALHH